MRHRFARATDLAKSLGPITSVYRNNVRLNDMKIVVAILLLAMMLIACQKHSDNALNAPMSDWSWIASVDGSDSILHDHISALLDKNGIECFLMGSVVYGVAVRNNNIDKGIDLLRKDQKSLGYGITIHKQKKSVEYPPHNEEWTTISPDIHYLDWTTQMRKEIELNFIALLKSRKAQEMLATHPYITELEYTERPYMKTDYVMGTGYVFSIELSNHRESNISIIRSTHQVWNDGASIR